MSPLIKLLTTSRSWDGISTRQQWLRVRLYNLPRPVRRIRYWLYVKAYAWGLLKPKKAKVLNVGTVQGDAVSAWGFDCSNGAPMFHFIGDAVLIAGHTLEELKALTSHTRNRFEHHT